MSVGTHDFLTLVKQAYEGKLQLPAFQRDWKWKRRQVVELFDSLRNMYPIGSFLMAKADIGFDLSPRTFKYASEDAEEVVAPQLVLDGQQRITAGIQLFFGKSPQQGTHYFLDISTLEKAFQQFALDQNTTVSDLLDDEKAIRVFVKSLDADAGYVRAVPRVQDPHSRLNSHHQVFTPLLLTDKEKALDTYLDAYFEKHPNKKPFVRSIVKPFFRVANTPIVPFILIEEADVEAVSRIFATLNTTGKLLTPFELVVAILFPKKVDLRAELAEAKKLYPTYYPNMDPTGEIALQTCVLLEGKDPKKSLLPKTLTKDIWERRKLEAFVALHEVGEFLSEHLGFALKQTNDYIPYDSVFAPLAYVYARGKIADLPAQKRRRAEDKLKRYVVGASLDQRYQEGVHNKQKSDADGLLDWVTSEDEARAPVWMSSVSIRGLLRVAPSGAIGKTILCLINRDKLKDPITGKEVELGSSIGEDHHVFPTRYVTNLKDWNEKRDTANVVLNIMRLEKETNASFLNSDPADQLRKALGDSAISTRMSQQAYRKQLISDDCLDVLRKPGKSTDDFYSFLKLREKLVQELITGEFGFQIAAGEIQDEEADS